MGLLTIFWTKKIYPYSSPPNPSDGDFTLSLPQGMEAATIITDAAGRMVKETNAKGTTSFSLEVAPGMYFISVQSAGGVMRSKMVVK